MVRPCLARSARAFSPISLLSISPPKNASILIRYSRPDPDRPPEEAFRLAPVLAEYRRHQERIHAGRISPIGEEPSGSSWTGFQSVRADGGYLAVYRELNDRPSARVRLWRPPEGKVELRPVIGSGQGFTATPDADGCVGFALPEPFSFALYEYRL